MSQVAPCYCDLSDQRGHNFGCPHWQAPEPVCTCTHDHIAPQPGLKNWSTVTSERVEYDNDASTMLVVLRTFLAIVGGVALLALASLGLADILSRR